ncbi:MAG: hypothetical protein NVSMB43_07620 [Pseudarthrobacter sp.]
MPMRWGDMDAYGHINNVQIVRMMEEARIAAFGPPRGTGKPGIEPEVGLFNEVPREPWRSWWTTRSVTSGRSNTATSRPWCRCGSGQ